MNRVHLLILIAGLFVSPAQARQKWAVESATLNVRQKMERHALKLKQKYARSSLKDANLSKAVRIQLKHKLRREQRRLRQRQKEERQTLKDRERLLNIEMRKVKSE